MRHHPSVTLRARSGLSRGLTASILITAVTGGLAAADIPAGYKGTPYGGAPRAIPGRIDFEDYDLGGMNIGWKSDDKAGQGVAPGSTAANRADDGEKDHPAFYITNSNPGEVDKLPDGTLYPSAEQPKSIYIGAAHATDFANVTVNVAKAGTYWISAHFASQPDQIKCHVSFNGVNKTPGLTLVGTKDYHAWRFYRNLAKVDLEAGVQVMQFMLDSYHLNWDYISFSADSNGVVGLAPRQGYAADRNLPSLTAQAGNGRLRFNLPMAGPSLIVILDSRGRITESLLDRNMAAGEHDLALPASAAPGPRFLRVTGPGSALALPLPAGP
ncbi:MAG: carbohydrate binding module family protein [Fibrobacteres bacterium]|nr:carbohydrate binding module family protein [Fibrobacterota bacterium]